MGVGWVRRLLLRWRKSSYHFMHIFFCIIFFGICSNDKFNLVSKKARKEKKRIKIIEIRYKQADQDNKKKKKINYLQEFVQNHMVKEFISTINAE